MFSKRGTRQSARLARLEHARGGGPPCPECEAYGIDSNAEPTYEIVFDDDLDAMGEDYPEENVYCTTCGELIYGVIEFPEDADGRDGGY